MLIEQNLLKICLGSNGCDLCEDVVARLEECVHVSFKNIQHSNGVPHRSVCHHLCENRMRFQTLSSIVILEHSFLPVDVK